MGTMAETRMSVDDRLVLRSDRDPRLRSTVATIAVLAAAPDAARLREAIDRVSRVVPRLRDRAVMPTVPTTEPRWVTDPDFDLDHHVRRVALPTGSTWEDLLALVETLIESPFDPSRPQWALTLVEGLDGGRAAIVAAVSSVIREGGHPLDLVGRIADQPGVRAPGSAHRSGREAGLPPEPVPTDLDPGDLAITGLKELPMRSVELALGTAREAVQVAMGLAERPQAALGSLVAAVRSAGDRLGRGVEPTAPTALNGRGVRRRILTLDIPADRAAPLVGGPLGPAHTAALTAAVEQYRQAVGRPDVAARVAVASHPAAVRAALDPSARETAAMLAPYGAFLPSAALDVVRGPVRVADLAAVTLGDRTSVASVVGVQIVAEYVVGPVPGNALTSVLLQRDGVLRVTVRFDPAAVQDEDALRDALVAGWARVAPPVTSRPRTRRAPARTRRRTPA